MEIDCWIPVTIRISGIPTPDQITELADTVVTAVKARLAEAERVLLDRHSTSRQPVEPDRGQPATGYRAHSRRVSVAAARTVRPWVILHRLDFHARVGRFFALYDALRPAEQHGPSDSGLYADQFDESHWIGLWLVRVNRDFDLTELSNELTARARQLARLRPDQVIATVVSASESTRQRLIAMDEDRVVAGAIPAIGPHNARRLDGSGATAAVRHGALLVFAFIVLPRVSLTDLADLGPTLTGSVPLREAAAFISASEFEDRYQVSWSEYLAEFGNEPVPVYLQGVTVRRKTRAGILTMLLDRSVAAAQGPLAAGEVESVRWLVLNRDTLAKLPPSLSPQLDGWSNEATRDSPDPGDEVPAGLAAAYAVTRLSINPDRVGAARYRKLARSTVAVLRRWLAGDPRQPSWAEGFGAFLRNGFADPPEQRPPGGTLFEYVLLELTADELAKLFDAADRSGNGNLRFRLLLLCLATTFADHPRVATLQEDLVARELSHREHTYSTDPEAISLNHDEHAAVRVGTVLGEVDSIYLFRRDMKALRHQRADELRSALVDEREKLTDAILKGTDSSTRDEHAFAMAAMERAVKRIGLTSADFVDITVERSMRLRAVREHTVAGGLPRFEVEFEFVERTVKGGAEADLPGGGTRPPGEWRVIGQPVIESADKFDARLIAWGLRAVAEMYEVATLAVTVVGMGLVALEIGLVTLLIDLAGGATAIAVSIGVSEIIYLLRALFGDATLSLRGFLEAALDGYLMALGFRFGGLLGRWAGAAITTDTLTRAVLGWIVSRLVTGVVGGAGTALLETFAHDLLRIALDGGSWSSLDTYVRRMTYGAAIGVAAEFVLAPALRATLAGARGALVTAREVADRLREAGWTADAFLAVSTEALANLRATITSLAGDTAAKGFAVAFGERLAAIATELGSRELALYVLELSGAKLSIAATAGLGRFLRALRATSPARAHEAIRAFTAHPEETARLFEVLSTLDQPVADHLAAGTFASPSELAALLGRLSRYTPQEQRAALVLLAELGVVAGPPVASGESVLRRQFAASLRVQAEGHELETARLQREADRLLAEAQRVESYNPDRAEILRARAELAQRLRARREQAAAAARAEADNATAGLPEPPTSAELDRALTELEAEGGEATGGAGEGPTGGQTFLRLRGAHLRDHPELLDRVLRPIFRSRTGNRVVFRVEGGGDAFRRSRGLIQIDAAGNVTVASRGLDVNLNFGVFERAVEFFVLNRRGAQLKVFEVEEGWFQSLRSTAVPERATQARLPFRFPGDPEETVRGQLPVSPPGAVRGQPRTVDVEDGADQLQVPAELVNELNEFIVPGSGRVLEFEP